jgi:antirestriction protein ArdC
MTTATAKADIYETVTNWILEALENGVTPWKKPWKESQTLMMLPRRFNGLPYHGMNIVILWIEAEMKGYKSNVWMTYNQAKKLGGNVKRGEKGTTVVYTSKFVKTSVNDAGEEKKSSIPFLKSYTVFNVDQIEKLPAKYAPKPLDDQPLGTMPIDELEAFFDTIKSDHKIVVKTAGDSAHYSPTTDSITMPAIEKFYDAESYYSTLGHEMIHWTGIRLAREFGKKFGDMGYAREELVAEMGAAFICGILVIKNESVDDHASYLEHWIKILKEDKKAIFHAASQASKAVSFLTGEESEDQSEE